MLVIGGPLAREDTVTGGLQHPFYSMTLASTLAYAPYIDPFPTTPTDRHIWQSQGG